MIMDSPFRKLALFFSCLVVLITTTAISAVTPKHSSDKTTHTIAHAQQTKKAKHTANTKQSTKHSKPATLATQTTKKKSHKRHTQHSKSRRITANTELASKRIPLSSINTHSLSSDLEIDNLFSKKEKSAFHSSIYPSLVNFAMNTVRTMRRTTYKLGGNNFDPSRGIYKLDCSAYVDNLLQKTHPKAYSILAQWSGTSKPTSADYFAFFDRPLKSEWQHWHKVLEVPQLSPGDILVFRPNKRKSGGHVMIVMSQPISDSSQPNVFWINVADSASSGHSNDTRPARTSGIGIGKLLVKINPKTKQVVSYAWKAGAHWKHNITFAMASPEVRRRLS